MSTKFRKIVLKPKIHRHLYSNNRGSVSETVFNTKSYSFPWLAAVFLSLVKALVGAFPVIEKTLPMVRLQL